MQQYTTKRRRKHRYAASIGGLFVGLAALGTVTVIYLCFRLTGAVLDNSSEKLMFENIIRPVVMFNPAPFEKATDIEMENLLNYSMWSALMGEGRLTYQLGDNSELVVPASDLDVAAARLFGPEVSLEHRTFGDYETQYYYDEENQIYNAPVSALLNVYTPSVETITKNGEFYELYVGYLSSGVSWQTDYSGGSGKPTAEKYMVYIMQRTKSGYYIVKVQNPESAPAINAQRQAEASASESGN